MLVVTILSQTPHGQRGVCTNRSDDRSHANVAAGFNPKDTRALER